MQHKGKLAAAGAALAVAVTPVVGLAATAPPAKTAKPIGSVARHGTTSATLKVKYSCKVGATLWISIKQAKDGKKDANLTKGGSSAVAAAWFQSHKNTVKCDGKKHTKKFTMDKKEQGKGTLVPGFAWLQFCVTKGNSLTVSVAKWVPVK
jgi:hypothetical protein